MRISAISNNKVQKNVINSGLQVGLRNNLQNDKVSFNGLSEAEKLMQQKLFEQMKKRQQHLLETCFGLPLQPITSLTWLQKRLNLSQFESKEISSRQYFKDILVSESGKRVKELESINLLDGQDKLSEFISRAYDNSLVKDAKTSLRQLCRYAYKLVINADSYQDGARLPWHPLPQHIKDMIKNAGYSFRAEHQGRQFDVTAVNAPYWNLSAKPYIKIKQTNLTPDLIPEEIKL